MKQRITFGHWGVMPARLRERVTVPAFCYFDADADGAPTEAVCRSRREVAGTPTEAVCQCIERATRLSVVTCRSDGVALSHGKPEARHYELTLGLPAPGGGWNVAGRMFVSVPCRASDRGTP